VTTIRPLARQKRTGPTGRIGDLDGYRGIAAVGIIVFHAYQFARGNATSSYAYQGTLAEHVLRNLDGLVSMFLILSGYLLYLPVARNAMRGERPGAVTAFLLRRAARILPLYWAAILLVWTYRNPALPGDWRDLVEHLTFTQVFDSRRIFYTIGPAWSLSVEVYFYVFLAVVYAVLNRWSARSRSTRARVLALLAAPVLLTVACLAWQGWALLIAHEPATRWSIWFNPLAKADMFAVGMLVAVLQVTRSNTATLHKAVLIGLRLGAVALLGYGCAVRGDDAATTTLFNLLSTAAFGLLIASSVFADPADRWRRMLSGQRLAWLGLISYSLYLWPEPVLLYLDTHAHLSHAQAMFPVVAILLLAASIPIAWLSYRLLEYPAGRLRLLLDSTGRRRDYYAAG
jgi:peptidoglycan/LPS O-acetylase OafA/YrhL